MHTNTQTDRHTHKEGD